jgi:hypothetical protein
MNNHVRFIQDLTVGQEILAFIKNYREHCIFCSLNIGVSGIVRDDSSIQALEQFHSFGDIFWASVLGFEHHKCQIRLGYVRPYSEISGSSQHLSHPAYHIPNYN